MSQQDKDLQKIKQLIDIMKKNDLVQIELSHGEDKILLKRSEPNQPQITAYAPAMNMIPPQPSPSEQNLTNTANQSQQDTQTKDDLVEIKSLMIGTYYAKPSPESEFYVETGSHVEPNTVVCIIEAMKVMNEIKAETSGTIEEILVENGQAVEYGQPLFRIKPD